jgi:hypothetical protein
MLEGRNELLTDNKNNGWQHNCHTFFNTDISHKMSAVLKQGKGKFVSALRQVCVFLRVLWFPSPKKLTATI